MTRPLCIEHTFDREGRFGPTRSSRRASLRASEPYPASPATKETVRVRFTNNPRARSATPGPSRPSSNSAQAASSISSTPQTPPPTSNPGRAVRPVLKAPRATPAPSIHSHVDQVDSDSEDSDDFEDAMEEPQSDSDSDSDDEAMERTVPINPDDGMNGSGVEKDGVKDDGVEHDVLDDFANATMYPVRTTKIRKPPGEVGRPNGGGYTLKTALGWSNEKYNAVRLFISKLVPEHLDCNKPLGEQPLADLRKIRQITIEKYPWIDEEYDNVWPIDDFVFNCLKYQKQQIRNQRRQDGYEAAQAELERIQRENEVLRATMPGTTFQESGAGTSTKAKKKQKQKPAGQPKARVGTKTRSMTAGN
ncbi:hypothetical protein V5O48_014137 [Marasmius crinis-equi]|uniref:Uncharacterized protein n=1 Tax=Marasmius crinis-equi TaxID=585013 RepID=A0ABR3EY43_9AGAR